MVWVALGLLALIDIWIVVFLYQKLKETELSLMQSLLDISNITVASSESLKREIKNIPKEMVIKNYLNERDNEIKTITIKYGNANSDLLIDIYSTSDKDIDILVNTTPVGMYPNIDQCPVSLNVINNSKVVMDIIFNPKITKLLEYANSEINGIYMLVLQAIKAEEIWQNQKIELNINELLTRM